jgi:transposase
MNKKAFLIQMENEIAIALIAGAMTHEEIAQQFGVTAKTVQLIGKRRKILRKRGQGSPAWKFKQQAQKLEAV